ncbi:MAG: hypothetical protein GY870_06515 [archaeon]|nr:hypothetical protein [archaeon]
MKKLLHGTKIKIKDGKFYRYGYVFSNDISLIYDGLLEHPDRNRDDDGKVFLMQESTVIDGKKKDKTEYIELKNLEHVLFGNKEREVRFLGNYSDMGVLVD